MTEKPETGEEQHDPGKLELIAHRSFNPTRTGIYH